MSLMSLLSRGYFPKELPPNLSTDAFAQAVVGSGVRFETPRDSSILGTHSLARAGGVRRVLGIPNPIRQYYLANEIAGEWPKLAKFFRFSPYSLSRPVMRDRLGQQRLSRVARRAAEPWFPLHDLARVRAERRCGKYILLLDVAECYRSLYTHSLPWALHGKKTAKRDRSDGLLGNRLDRCVRNAQDQQTNGFPVGPDTSLVLAEVILTAIDKAVKGKVRSRGGLRYYDDLELYFDSYGDAEYALSVAQFEFASFDLQINPSKTAIRELPLPVESPWIAELRDFSFGASRCDGRQRVLEYFDRVFELWRAQRDANVVAYGLTRIAEEAFADGVWLFAQRLMHQAALAEPSSLPKLLFALSKFERADKKVDRSLLAETLGCVISGHAPSGHASEVAWALWGALAFRVKLDLDAPSRRALAGMADSVVALLALDARRRKLLSSNVSTDLWASCMTAEHLRDSAWLLAYEANVQGWLQSVGSADHVLSEREFAKLKRAGVTFYRPVEAVGASVGLLDELRGHTGSGYSDDTRDEDDDEAEDEGQDESEEEFKVYRDACEAGDARAHEAVKKSPKNPAA